MRQSILLFCLLWGLWIRAAAPAGDDASFEVKLGVENGHLAAVVFGMAAAARNGFDREYDSPAPPPGRGTGYTAFLLPKTGMFLYRDIKAPADRLLWTFFGRVHGGKAITLTWQAGDLPAGYSFRIAGETGKDEIRVDMRKQQSLTLEKSRQIRIIAVPATASARDSKEEKQP